MTSWVRGGCSSTGIVVFTLASLACGLAWNPASLVVARAAQGVGGALASAVVLGLIVKLYAEPAARNRAFAVFAFVGSAGASVGVVAGGLLVSLTSWHWVFLVNVPIGIVALLGARAASWRTTPFPGWARRRSWAASSAVRVSPEPRSSRSGSSPGRGSRRPTPCCSR